MFNSGEAACRLFVLFRGGALALAAVVVVVLLVVMALGVDGDG